MLQMMREWLRYLKWILVLVIFSFLWWGADTWVGGRSSVGPQTDWAARVNGETIRASSFRTYARNLDNTYQSILGDQYTQQRSFLRLGQQAIDQLVEEELLYQEALNQGIRVSKQEIAASIRSDPNFQEGGRFIGLQRYRDMFRGARFSIEEYEAQIHRSLLIEKCRRLVADGVMVTDVEIRTEFRRRNETATIDYLVIDPEELLKDDLPDDDSVERFYREHQDRYMRGEGRTGIYVLFNATELAAIQEPTEAEIRAAYDRDQARLYDVKEQRRASHILFRIASGAADDEVARIEGIARGVLDQARGGAEFAELAKQHSEDSTAVNGGDLDFFGRGQMVPEFETAAFDLPVGDVSDLVRTTYGFHIIKVTDSREARTVPFDEVRDRIRQQISLARGRTEAVQRAGTMARAASGGRLEAVAKSQGLLVHDVGSVHSGDSIPTLQSSQQVVTQMLTMSVGDVSAPIPIPSGQVIVQVNGVVADTPRPLEEVRDRVRTDAVGETARGRVDQAIRSTREKGEAIGALARTLGAELKTEENLARGAILPGVVRHPDIDGQLRSLSPASFGDPVLTSSGLVVLNVRERFDHQDEYESQKDATREALLRQQRDRLIRGFVRQLRESGDIVINEPLVQALDRG